MTEPLSNWKTSFGLAEQGRSFLCQLLLLTALLLSTATYLGMLGTVRETTSRQPPLPPNPVNKSAWYSSSSLPQTDTWKTLLQGPWAQPPKSDARTSRLGLG